MEVPSMVRRSGDKLIVRRVVSGEQLVLDPDSAAIKPDPDREALIDKATQPRRRTRLPQCRVKRNYSCDGCGYSTQNPRSYLTHRRDNHGERISINECPRCLYASRHHQKVVRHMAMVHGVSAAPSGCETGSREANECPLQGPGAFRSVDGGGVVLDASERAQQLVASPTPTTVKDIEQSWAKAILANIEILKSLFAPEMDGVPNPAAFVPDQDPIRDGESVPKKRPRPIPNLIPLDASGAVPPRPEKELLKPVPMSVLMPPDPALDSQMKCTFCELTFEATVELANHIATAHKEDLITSLLQRSMDDSNQNLFPQVDADGASNDLWKTLLEANVFRGATEPDGKHPSAASKDDDEVELLDHRTETFCGVETAPGYGEVTSKVPVAEGPTAAVMKKVFKCPHCSFWASTASRFHVHIVGHLNKKPFECSLCSYRSNWRWDITKHIRLKTIRDPGHKNAGVLMNDETGRRNYTKYNKYVTLMQITDNSTRDAVGFPKPEGGSVSDLTYNIDLSSLATIPGLQLLLDDKHLGETDEGVPMKCQSCEFRTSSREELVVHMVNSHTGLQQTHGEDVHDGTESVPANSATQSKTSTANSSSTPTASSTPTPPTAAFGSLGKGAANTSPTNGTLLTPAAGGAGEGEAGATPRGGMSGTWRHSAPYRCGHCHQVSNWKHVIQRHCRLKHNGHVIIEHVNAEKDADSGDGDGHGPRNVTSTPQPGVFVVDDRKSLETVVGPSIPPPPPLAPFQLDEVATSLEPIVEILDKDPTELVGFDGEASTVLINSGTVAPVVPGEPLECISCSFRAETVEQLTEHLEQHMQTGPDASGLIDPVPTTMYYCSRCPARFFDEGHTVEHGAKHGATEGHACSVCSYAAADEDERNRHAEVHSAAYNINTENLQIFLAESKDFPRPQLAVREAATGEQVFYIAPPEQPVERLHKDLPKRAKRPKQRALSRGSTDDGQLRSIFLCEYCDRTFDAESDLNGHVKEHFASILAPQGVTYYTSLSGTLNRDRKLELVVSGAESSKTLHYVYDNTRRKEWNAYSKSESVMLKL